MITRMLRWGALLILLTACSRPSTPTPTPIPTMSPEAEISVKVALAAEFHSQPSDFTILSSQRQDWPDACLGVGQPGEVCAAGVVSGWLLLIDFDGTTYKVRANDDASIVRIASPLP